MKFQPISIISIFLLFIFPGSIALAGDVQITEIKQLTDASMDVDHPAWSPDNRFIAISNIETSDAGEADELWLLDVQSGRKQKLLGEPQLKRYSTYGYSIRDIQWKDQETLIFVVSDNDVDSWSITLPVKNPKDMAETFISYEEADLSDFPEDLKTFLLGYYPEDSSMSKDLIENYYFFQIKEHDGLWFVHHLRDADFLAVDLKTGKVTTLALASKDIGDELVFKTFGKYVFAIYPPSIESKQKTGRSWYHVDLIGPEGTVTPVFQTMDSPEFKRIDDNSFFVYSRTGTEHPFFRVELMSYAFGRKTKTIPTDGWHNLDISEDNTRIAFIKVMNGKRVLFTGKLQ